MENTMVNKEKGLSPRVSGYLVDFLAEYCTNQTAGAEYALCAFRSIVMSELASIRGQFTRDELKAIVRAAKNYASSSEQFGMLVRQQIENAIDTYLWQEVSPETRKALAAKLEKLSASQLGALDFWAHGYDVKRNDYEATPGTALDEYVSGLLLRQRDKDVAENIEDK